MLFITTNIYNAKTMITGNTFLVRRRKEVLFFPSVITIR